MSYKDIINNIEKIDYSKYESIKGDGKFIAYAGYVLNKLHVPLTFNYLCIAAFKLFPDILCCDEEFKEFPSIDRLNRAHMHAKHVQNGKPLITGTTKDGYELTSYGLATALEMESHFNNTAINKDIKVRPVDKHKKGVSNDYFEFIETEGFKEYASTGKVNLKYLWKYCNVIPFTQLSKVKERLDLILTYAKSYNNDKCIEYVNELLKQIN